VWLVNPNRAMCDAFRQRFEGLPDVRVVEARYEALEPHDCFVTAANAYGIMNAGIDAAVVSVHGETLMRRIQLRILDDYLGEQPVGTSFIEPTGTSGYPFVAHTPTMRTPSSIDGTDTVYRATWAAFLAVYQHNLSAPSKIATLAFPAMGAGFGRVPYGEVARQMAAAYRHYLEPPHRLDWDTVIRRQRAILYDGDVQVAKP